MRFSTLLFTPVCLVLFAANTKTSDLPLIIDLIRLSSSVSEFLFHKRWA